MASLISHVLAQAPVLAVVAPVLAAVVAAAGGPRLALGAGLFGLGCSVAFLATLALGAASPIGVTAGGWAAPLGVTVRIDALAKIAALIAALAGLAGLAALGGVSALRPHKAGIAVALILLAHAGLCGAALAGDLATLALWLELASLALIALAALGGERDRRAFAAAFEALIVSGLGSALLWTGVAFILVGRGGLEAELLAGLARRSDLAGLALIVVGVAMKTGLAPFQAWSVAIQGAGAPAAAPLAIAGLGFVGVVALARLTGAVGAEGAGALALSWTLLGCGTVGALIGAAQALAATDVRRVFAALVSAQLGLAVVGLALGGESGLTAGLLSAVFQALAALAFAALGVALALQGGQGFVPLVRLDGFGRRAPLMGSALTAALLSVIGAPLLAGFLAKWMLVNAAIAAGGWWAAALTAFVALAAVVAGGRVLARLWQGDVDGPATSAATLAVLTPALLIATIASLAFGLDAQAPLAAAQAGARAALGLGP